MIDTLECKIARRTGLGDRDILGSLLWLTVLFFLLLPGAAFGQGSTTGSVAGNVVDASGAAVQGAQILLVGESSGLQYKTQSSTAGVYRIPGVQPGRYTLQVSSQGFATSSEKGVLVELNRTSSRDITLGVGQQSVEVSVNATAPTVETQTSDISTTVTPRQVDELPLSLGGTGALRSAEAFEFLIPGVSGPGTLAGGASGVFAARISGGQAMGQEVLLDGASVDRTDWHSEFDEIAPSVEALQEFTVSTSTIPADYSRTAGGIVTFGTKSGTNEYHGMLYDIFRNDDLDANLWFNNGYLAQAIAGNGGTAANYPQFRRPTDKKNDFGGTFGGPVRIPHLYDGRNRSFVFYSYERYLQSTSGVTISTLPTPAEKGGDFSALLGAPTGKINPCDGTSILTGQIFDPATTRTVDGVNCRTAFPRNMINPTRFSSVANKTLPSLPTPTTNATTLNYSFPDSFPVVNSTWTLRGDQVLSSSQKLSLIYSHRLNSSQVGLRSLPLPLDPGHQNIRFGTDFARVLHTWTLTPNLVNQVVIGYNRYDSANQMPTAGGGVSYVNELGLTNVSGYDFPQFNFADAQGITTIGSNINNEAIDDGYRINDNVTWVHGRSSLDVGFNGAYQAYAPNNFANTQGAFNFSSSQTAPEPSFGPTAGSAFASFLLGDVGSAGATDYASQAQWRSNFFAGYAQDTFKLTKTLVVNYGLNWSVELPRRELHNHDASFDPTLTNPQSGTPGALLFASGSDRSFTNTYYKDFSPRFGFAWAPKLWNNTLAIRGGYGIYYDSLFYGDTGDRTLYGYKATPFFNSLDGFAPAFQLDNGFPAYTKPPFISPSLQDGQGVDYVARSHNAPGYIQNWSLEIQQQLAPDLLFSLGYVGTKGNRLRSSLLATNAIPLSALQLGTVLNEPLGSADATTAGVSTPFPAFSTLYGAGTVAQALRPFAQFQTIDTGDLLENVGMSSYNAMEAELQRRFRNGLNVLVSYTWSKTLTDSDALLPFFASTNGGGSVQDPYNRRGERAISNEDTPHQFVASYIYELPVGKHRKFLAKAPPVVSQAISGWQVSGVQRYQSGQPIAFGGAIGIPGLDSTNRYNFTGKPVVIGSGEKHPFNPFDPAHNSWLSNAAFVDPNANVGPFRAWQFGNVPRVDGQVRTQNFYNESFSLQKNTNFTEGVFLEFRAEAFNAFNRHTFGLPNVQPFTTTFGQVTSTIDAPRNLQITLRLHY